MNSLLSHIGNLLIPHLGLELTLINHATGNTMSTVLTLGQLLETRLVDRMNDLLNIYNPESEVFLYPNRQVCFKLTKLIEESVVLDGRVRKISGTIHAYDLTDLLLPCTWYMNMKEILLMKSRLITFNRL